MMRPFFPTAALSLALLVGCGDDNEAPTGGQTAPNATESPSPASTANPAPGAETKAPTAAADEAVEFVRMAASANMFDIQASQLILDKNVGGEEKEFAQLSLTDHRKVQEELTALATSKNLTVPTQLDPEHQEKLDKLKTLSGEQLAEEYHEMQQEAHESAVALFENASKNLQDPELKAFATRTLPTLKSHLQKLGAHNHHH